MSLMVTFVLTISSYMLHVLFTLSSYPLSHPPTPLVIILPTQIPFPYGHLVVLSCESLILIRAGLEVCIGAYRAPHLVYN